MRIVHIQKNPQTSAADPTYDIIDAGRYGGEEAAAAEILYSLESEQVGDWLERQGLKYSMIKTIMAQLGTSDSTEVQLPLRAGPNIVRAWFDTVINPLVQSLRDELILLGKRNWTFSYRPARLDLIREIRGYLPYADLANLDQLLRSSGEPLESLVVKHDDNAERLQGAVASTHSLLTANRQFRDLCESLFSSERLAELGITSLDQVFGPYLPAEHYEVLAQYLVNSTGLLSSHYSTAKFWNHNRVTLLAALKFPGIREQYSSALVFGDALADTSRTLLDEFRNLRDQLSLRYDVPPVTSAR